MSPYLQSNLKSVLDKILAILVVICGLPVLVAIAICIFIDNGSPILFVQERVGKNGKIFIVFKFRTMTVGAKHLQKKYQYLNQADGPVFKVVNDPRFTKFGKILSKSGLDELPQIFNILKGEMSLVGPRPLPWAEERQINIKYRKIRQLVKPGITSPWVVGGASHISFSKWMDLDVLYIEQANLKEDIKVIFRSLEMLMRLISYYLKSMGNVKLGIPKPAPAK
jgi:lipopolysaccharide/colanic/teichoic acid biosynthesis glycosyltransferase